MKKPTGLRVAAMVFCYLIVGVLVYALIAGGRDLTSSLQVWLIFVIAVLSAVFVSIPKGGVVLTGSFLAGVLTIFVVLGLLIYAAASRSYVRFYGYGVLIAMIVWLALELCAFIFSLIAAVRYIKCAAVDEYIAMSRGYVPQGGQVYGGAAQYGTAQQRYYEPRQQGTNPAQETTDSHANAGVEQNVSGETSARVCPACGKTNAEGTNFCMYCGSKLNI